METIITALIPIAIKLITSWITGKAEKDEKHKKALESWLKFVEDVRDYGESARLKKEADSARERLRARVDNGALD